MLTWTPGPTRTPSPTESPDQRAIEQTAKGFFDAYDAAVADTNDLGFFVNVDSFLPLVQFIDPLSTCSASDAYLYTDRFLASDPRHRDPAVVAHAVAYARLKKLYHDYWSFVAPIDATGPDATTDRGVFYIDADNARVGITLSHEHAQTGKAIDPTDEYAYSLRRSNTSLTGWVFTADEEYATNEQFRFFLGPYEPLPDVGSYCGP